MNSINLEINFYHQFLLISQQTSSTNHRTNLQGYIVPINSIGSSKGRKGMLIVDMFSGVESSNQNLAKWCVKDNGIELDDFATSSPLDTNANKPIWGTCP